jgi:hypothetical protein
MSQAQLQQIELEEERVQEAPPETRKPYARPAITYELELETRAGCPLSIPGQFNPFNLDNPFGIDPQD